MFLSIISLLMMLNLGACQGLSNDDPVISLSIGVVASNDGSQSGTFQWDEAVRPRRDVTVQIHFEWNTINPRDPFLSARKTRDAQACEVDIMILSSDWPSVKLLVTSLTSPRRRVLLWHGGVVKEIDQTNTGYQHEGPQTDCSMHHLKYPSLPPAESTLHSEMLAIKDIYIAAITKLLEYLQWDTFVFVTDHVTVSHLSELLSKVTDGRHVTTQLEIRPDSSNDQIFNAIGHAYNKTRNGRVNVLLLCEIDCTLRVLHQTFDSKMAGTTALSYMSRWLVLALPEYKGRIEESTRELNNIALLTPHHEGRGDVSVTELSQFVHDTVIDVFTSSNLSRMKPEVTLFAEDYRNTTVEALINKITSKDRSDPCPSCDVFHIYTVLWKQAGRQFAHVGSWQGKQTLQLHKDGIFPNINYGFNNQTFRVVTNRWPLFVEKNGATDEYEGLCIDLLLELSTKLNFSYTVYEPDDGDWGVLNDDGHWTGLVGELEFRRANLSIAPLSVTADREKVADFAYPFYYDYNGVLIKKPDPSKTKWRTLIDIFTYPVYVGIAISLPTMSLLVYLSERYNPYYKHILKGRRFPQRGLHNFQDTIWYMYGALLTQGGVFLPKSQTGRTLLSFWWLYSIIMVASYSGNLIASLTVTKDKLPFETLREMVNQREYKWGTTYGTYLNVLFQESNITDFKKIWEGMNDFSKEIDSMNPNHSYHIAMVKEGGYAYINDKSGMIQWVSNECDLVFIKEEFFPMPYSIGLPRESPFRDMFSDQMLKILESGLMQMWKQKWWPKQNFCSGPIKATATRITLTDVQSAFYLLFIGAFLGVLAVLGEFSRHILKTSRDEKSCSKSLESVSPKRHPMRISENSLGRVRVY